jgi:hypothetical protein
MTTAITPELLDQLLANYERPEDLTGDNGLFKQLKKALIERALGALLYGTSEPGRCDELLCRTIREGNVDLHIFR